MKCKCTPEMPYTVGSKHRSRSSICMTYVRSYHSHTQADQMLDSMKSSLSTLDMSQAEESHLHM